MNNEEQNNEIPEGYEAPKVAKVGGSYYELRPDGHRVLPNSIDYVPDIVGIAPSYSGNTLKKALKKRKRNGGPNRKINKK